MTKLYITRKKINAISSSCFIIHKENKNHKVKGHGSSHFHGVNTDNKKINIYYSVEWASCYSTTSYEMTELLTSMNFAFSKLPFNICTIEIEDKLIGIMKSNKKLGKALFRKIIKDKRESNEIVEQCNETLADNYRKLRKENKL